MGLPNFGLVAMLAVCLVPSLANAGVVAKVDVKRQTMSVYVDGQLKHEWPVSTARKGYVTPGGKYRPERLERMWYSKKYDNAPMPYAVFYNGGYAIHGTQATRGLGRPASHGCVRLRTDNAARFYNLVRTHGERETRILIDG